MSIESSVVILKLLKKSLPISVLCRNYHIVRTFVDERFPRRGVHTLGILKTINTSEPVTYLVCFNAISRTLKGV